MFNPIVTGEQAKRIQEAMQAATAALKFDRTVFAPDADYEALVSDQSEQRATYFANVL